MRKFKSIAGKPRQEGFSLIEALMAVAIFSIGLMAVAGMQIAATNKNTSSKKQTMALEYAADYLERLISLGTDSNVLGDGVDNDADAVIDNPEEMMGWGDLAVAGNPHRSTDNIDYDNNLIEDIPVHPAFNDIFTLTWTVTDSVAVPNTKEVTVTVRWPGGNFITLNGAKSLAVRNR